MAKVFEIGFKVGAALGKAFHGSLTSAQQKIKLLGDEANRLETAKRQADRFANLRKSIRSTQRDIAAASTEIARLEHMIKSTDNPSKRLVNALRAEKEHAAGLNSKLREQNRDLATLKDRMGDAAKSAGSLARHQARVADALNRTKKAQADLKEIGAQRQAAGSSLISATGVAASLGAALYAPVSAAIGFESSMADVKKVVDFDSPAQFEKMRTDLLGVTRILPMAAGGLAKIMASAGQAGIARQELLRFTVDAAKMGVAFDMAGEEAGSAMTGMRSIFALNQDGAVLLGDAYNHLANNMDATARGIVEIGNRVGPMGRMFGLSGEQVGALSATFLSLKTAPEVASTGINALLQRLATADKQTEDFQKALSRIGLDATALKAAIHNDAQGALLQFLEAVKGSDDVMGTLSDLFGGEYSDDIAKLVGGLDTYRAALGLVGKQSEYAGSMLKEYQERSKTSGNNLQLFKNSINELGISIGTALLPSIDILLLLGSKLAIRLSELAQRFPRATAIIVGVSAGLVALNLAVVAGVYGFTLLKGAWLGLNTVFAASPIGWITLAVGALVIGGVLLYKHWDKVVNLWHRFSKALENPAFMTFALMIAPFITMPALILKHWEPIKVFFTDLWGVISGVNEKLSKLWPFGDRKTGPQTQISSAGLKDQLMQQHSSVTNMQIQPTINVAAGADYGQVKAAVAAGMSESERRFGSMLNNYLSDQRRLAYE